VFGKLLLSKVKSKQNNKSLPTICWGGFFFRVELSKIKKKFEIMLKYLFSILLSFMFFNSSLANDINIQENIKLTFVCDLDKKIIKNSEYNYQTFLAKDLDEKSLGKFEIEAIKPEQLSIKGLSSFLSKSDRLNVKIVNKDVVLFKAVDKKKNYSESAIIDRKSGELIHEITRNIKSENSEKDISFYSCSKKEKKV
jgi:hypothetical protein